MKKLTQPEILALNTILKLESHGLIIARAMKPLIDDENLKKLAETGLLEMENRILAIKKFVMENVISEVDI